MTQTRPFELLEVIGRGSMGTVWKASLPDGQVAAVKMLHEHLRDDIEYVARFEREVELTQRVRSPHVVQTLGFGQLDGVPYLVMEYVPPPTLRQVIHREGPLACAQAMKVTRDVVVGLEAIHAAGIIHRDIKPSNILSPLESAKLADFGVAKASDVTRLTATAATVGTVAYMPPESSPGPTGDFYSLGCVLYEMLAGAPPFEGDSYAQVFVRQLNEMPDLERVPRESRPLLSWLLSKSPALRPSSAAELMAAIDGRQAIPVQPAPTFPPGEQSRPVAPAAGRDRPVGRWLVVAGIACTLVLVAAVALMLMFTRGGDDAPPILAPRSASLGVLRVTKENMFIQINSLEVVEGGDLRVHEQITNKTGIDWGWMFDATGGTYIIDARGAKVLPIRWSVEPGNVTSQQANAPLKIDESKEVWVEFPPFRGIDRTFTFHDEPAEFLNLSLSQASH